MSSTLTRTDESQASAYASSSPMNTRSHVLGAIDSLYHREIERFDLLTAEEVVLLAQRMERGHAAARNPAQPGRKELIEAGKLAQRQLIEANLRLVIHIARRYRGLGLDLPDLVQEGNVGLMRAVERFNWRKGYRFSTYAIWFIRQAIVQALVEQAHSIPVPLYKSQKIMHLIRVRKQLEQRMEGEPTLEDLAQEMDIGVKEVMALLADKQRQKALSLDLTNRVGDEEIPLGELLADDEKYTPEQEAIARSLEEELRALLAQLPERERRVIKLRYGLDCYRAHTLTATAEKVGVSYEAVRQIEARALVELAALAPTYGLEAYL